MTIPVLFEFETLPIQVISGEGGEHWLRAKDVCACTAYA
jgi:prophage antirepressor-like protein